MMETQELYFLRLYISYLFFFYIINDVMKKEKNVKNLNKNINK